MKNYPSSIFTLMILLGFMSARSQTNLLALSKGDHTLSIIDPITFKTKAVIPVGDDPHEIIASTNGELAFVSNAYGSNQHEINVIDLKKNKRLEDVNISPFSSPHGLDFSTGKLFFSAEGSSSIGSYDPMTKKMDWAMGTGQDRTHMIWVSQNGKNIYTTNVNAGTVSIFEEQQQKWKHQVIPVEKSSEGFDVSPDGKELWTAAASNGIISIIDLTSKQLKPNPTLKVIGANRLKFTSNGDKVLVSSLRNGHLFILNAQKNALEKEIPIGKGCAGILVYPDSKKALVACTPDNYIAVIDLTNFEILHKIEIKGPDGMAWSY